MADSQTLIPNSLLLPLRSSLVADVLLWRKWHGSLLLLVFATFLWLLFTFGGYNPISFVANVFLLLVTILFVWAKSASLLNRPLPPILDLEVSDKAVEKATEAIRIWANQALAVAHEIAVCGNLRVLLQVAALLWLVTFVGNLCNFVTFVYIGVVLSLSIPVIYEKYQCQMDGNLRVVCRSFDLCYRVLDRVILRRIPVSLYQKKKKKTQ